MSWDALISAANEPPPPVAGMADDWRGEPLGTPSEVRAKIDVCIPDVDWSDPAWGTFMGDGYSYEFNIGEDDPCEDFMVHVRGSGSAVTPLLALAKQWDWYILDCSVGEWLHLCDSPEKGWQEFQAYRDRVVADSRVKSDSEPK